MRDGQEGKVAPERDRESEDERVRRAMRRRSGGQPAEPGVQEARARAAGAERETRVENDHLAEEAEPDLTGDEPEDEREDRTAEEARLRDEDEHRRDDLRDPAELVERAEERMIRTQPPVATPPVAPLWVDQAEVDAVVRLVAGAQLVQAGREEDERQVDLDREQCERSHGARVACRELEQEDGAARPVGDEPGGAHPAEQTVPAQADEELAADEHVGERRPDGPAVDDEQHVRRQPDGVCERQRDRVLERVDAA